MKYSDDLDVVEFVSEQESFKFQASTLILNVAKATSLNLLQMIHTLGLEDVYPYTEIALRIFLTKPSTVATRERSFSKAQDYQK